MSEQEIIGVYICEGCGIGDVVDIDAMAAVATDELKIPLCRKHGQLCGEQGVKLIADDVASGAVTKPVIAACSPRVMADKFAFDGAYTVRANLREQVAWCHKAE